MLAFLEFLDPALIQALGWTVLHSLWQGLLLALLLALGGLLAPRCSARVRYGVANAALALMLIVSGITFALQYRPLPAGAIGAAEAVPAAGGLLAVPVAGAGQAASVPLEGWATYFEGHLPLIVTIWLLGVALFGLRLLGSLLFLRGLRRRGAQPASAEWQARLQRLVVRLRVRRPVQLLESYRVAVPMVVGFLKPVILMPVGALNGLTAQQVEAILAHELAHIARADYLFNLLQSVVEVLYYFNPGVWWIAGQVRQEREHCCDDIAVALCGDQLDYARALVELQELSQRGPRLAMTFSGGGPSLLGRVQRLLQPGQGARARAPWRLLATGLLLLALLVVSGGTGEPVLARAPERPLGLAVARVAADTIPAGRSRLEIVGGDDSRVEVVTEDGQIKSLRLDGRPVPADSLKDYQSMVEQWYEQLESPPAEEPRLWVPAPAPPRPRLVVPDAPLPPAAPDAPVPPAAPGAPLPPGPPETPLPSEGPRAWVAPYGRQHKITTSQDEEGNTVVRIETRDGEVTEMVVGAQGGEPVIILEGREIDPEESTIILKGVPGFRFRSPDSLDLGFVPGVIEERIRGLRLDLEDIRLTTDSLLVRGFDRSEGVWAWRDSAGLERWRIDSMLFDGSWIDSMPFGRDWIDSFRFEIDSLIDDTRFNFQWEQGPAGSFRTDPGAVRFFGRRPDNAWNDAVRAAFEAAMREDGILAPDEKAYHLEFSRSAFRVNDVEQEEAVLQRYIELYERISGGRLLPTTRFVIRYDEADE